MNYEPITAVSIARFGGMRQVKDKGYANQHRGHGGQGVVDGKLTAQGLCHLPAVHAQLLQELKLLVGG